MSEGNRQRPRMAVPKDPRQQVPTQVVVMVGNETTVLPWRVREIVALLTHNARDVADPRHLYQDVILRCTPGGVELRVEVKLDYHKLDPPPADG